MVGQVLYGEAQTLVWSGCTYVWSCQILVWSRCLRGEAAWSQTPQPRTSSPAPLPRNKRQPREVHARSPASHCRVASCGLVARLTHVVVRPLASARGLVPRVWRPSRRVFVPSARLPRSGLTSPRVWPLSRRICPSCLLLSVAVCTRIARLGVSCTDFRGHWPVFCMRLPAQAASLCVAVTGDPTSAGNHLKWRCNPSPGSCRLHHWG